MERVRPASSMVGGLVLLVLGVLFLVANFMGGNVFFAMAWPFLVLGAGGVFFLGMLLGGPGLSRLAIPGSIFSMVGLILLLQNSFGHWESWSYAWTLILIASGFGLFVSGWWGHDQHSRQVGSRLMILGSILFLAFAGFFEFVLGFSTFGSSAQIAWAIGLIMVGLILIARSSGLFGRLR